MPVQPAVMSIRLAAVTSFTADHREICCLPLLITVHEEIVGAPTLRRSSGGVRKTPPMLNGQGAH